MFGLYWFLLRKEKLFIFNRFFLVLSVVFSLVVPFISIPVNFQTTPKLENIIPTYNYVMPEISSAVNIIRQDVNINQPYVGKQPSPIDISEVLLALYISGVVLFLIRFLRNIYMIISKIKISEKRCIEGYRIILTNDKTGPYCFFSNLFLNREDYLNGKIDKEVFDHELEHVRQSHTLDIILIEIVKIFYWFNPIHLLYDRAIRLNHEYLADNGVINDNINIKSYSEKLLSFITGRSNMLLTSGSNHSFTKMRLMMITKSGSRSVIYGIRIAMTLCLVSVFFLFLSFKESDKQPSAFNLSETETEMTQNIVRGIVLTEDGKPLEGASIKFTKSNNTTYKFLVSSDGRFTFNNIQTGASLLIEHVGFIGQTIKPDFVSEMVVKLIRDPDYKGKILIPESQYVIFRNSDFTPTKALVVIDDVIIDYKANLKVNPGEIKSFKILTDKETANKYGDKAKDGVVEIILYGNKTESTGKNQAASNNVPSDTSKYNTFLSVNHVSNKGELIDIPVSNLKYITVWTHHDIDNIDKKGFRTIGIMTRDYYKVIGRVVQENGKPLSGVKIGLSENPFAETSDKDGRFIIGDVRENALLEFSHPGFEPYYINTSFVQFNMELTIELKKDDLREKDEILVIAEKMPQYPGGDMELKKFIATNMIYPEEASAQRAEGVVMVRFVVNTVGNIKEVEIIQRVHPAIDAEVLRIVSKLERFIPGSQGGKPVNVYYMLPITFGLPRTKSSKSQDMINISGTWELDLSKSIIIIQRIISSTLIITQNGNDITINRTLNLKDSKPLVSTFKYTIGDKVESKSKNGIHITTSSWGPDKQTFSIIHTYPAQRNGITKESKRTSVYSLTDQGNTLNIISDDTLPEGSLTPKSERHMVMIYTKK